MTHNTFPPPAPPRPKTNTARNILIGAAVAIAAFVFLAPDPEPAPLPSSSQLLETVWADLTISDRTELCDGYELLGTEASYQAFISGMGSADVNRNDFHAFFNRKCP